MKDEDYYKESHGGTQDERLLETPHADEFLHTDTWRVFRIMGEFTGEAAAVTNAQVCQAVQGSLTGENPATRIQMFREEAQLWQRTEGSSDA